MAKAALPHLFYQHHTSLTKTHESLGRQSNSLIMIAALSVAPGGILTLTMSLAASSCRQQLAKRALLVVGLNRVGPASISAAACVPQHSSLQRLFSSSLSSNLNSNLADCKSNSIHSSSLAAIISSSLRSTLCASCRLSLSSSLSLGRLVSSLTSDPLDASLGSSLSSCPLGSSLRSDPLSSSFSSSLRPSISSSISSCPLGSSISSSLNAGPLSPSLSSSLSLNPLSSSFGSSLGPLSSSLGPTLSSGPLLPSLTKAQCSTMLPRGYATGACGSAAGGPRPGGPLGPARGAGKALSLGLPGVDKVVAVASGKGGVGKSTTAVNLAVAMSTQLGMKVGLLDADIHGPSIPTLMNLNSKPVVQERGARKLLLPLENYGVKCMSMGFFTKGDAPVVWRGPIVHTAISQFLMDTVWGSLDVLLVDMPPGTGDAQITLGQRLPLAGAVIVSTPQDLAVLDARRGAHMFGKVNVPLLGFVSNMSYYQCPHCSTRDYIFGQGGVEKAARELSAEVLGEVPLDICIRVKSDQGVPVVLSSPDSLPAQAYFAIAQRIKEKLAIDASFTQQISGMQQQKGL